MNNVHQLSEYRGGIGGESLLDTSVPDGGFMCLYRALKKASFYKNSKKKAVWIHMLLSASHKPYLTIVGNETITLQVGQFVSGRAKIAEELGDVSEKSVRLTISYFEKKGMLTRKKLTKGTVYTVVNFAQFNAKNTEKRGQVGASTLGQQKGQQKGQLEAAEYIALDNKKVNERASTKATTKTPTGATIQQYNINTKPSCQIANANDRGEEGIIFTSDQPVLKVKSAPVPFQKIADSYNELIGDDFPKCQSVSSTKRKTAIRKFWKEMRCDLSRVQSYFTYFAEYATPHQRGQNDRGWKADIEFICRDTTVEKMRELGE